MWDFQYRSITQSSKSKPFDSRSQIGEGNHFLSIRITGFPVKCTTRLVYGRRVSKEKNELYSKARSVRTIIEIKAIKK